MRTKTNLPMKKRMSLALAGTLAVAAVVPSFGNNIVSEIRQLSQQSQMETTTRSSIQIKEAVQSEKTTGPQIVGNGMSVEQRGHRLTMKNDNNSATTNKLDTLGYYLFDATKEKMTLEADIEIKATGAGGTQGIFVGMFTDGASISNIATLGIRGDKKIRNIYNKATSPSAPGAGGINVAYAVGDKVHVLIQKTDKGWYTKLIQGDSVSEKEVKYSETVLLDDENTSVRYGFGFSNAEAVVRNLTYTDAAGNIVYKQSDVYEAVGNAPQVSKVNTPIISEDRTTIALSWEGEECTEDGAYKVEMSKDGGKTYETLSTSVVTKSYVAKVYEDGAYTFRISGVCGNKAPSEAVVSSVVEFQAPLNQPVLEGKSSDKKITLSWMSVPKAEKYELYKKHIDDGEYTLVDTLTDTTYIDTAIDNEEPYYYYIVAKSPDNYSNPSEPLLMLATAGRSGKYVYESEAAGITMTKKSYDTVYKDEATLEGVVDQTGEMALEVNGQIQEKMNLKKGQAFAFKAKLKKGRNDVNLLFTDANGKVTRQTFNFVYLTNYDIVVDQNYQGKDGEIDEATGAKMYSTVQAAVNSVPSNNEKRTVILIKEGSYVEYLRIESPYITLIGEDREKVNINFYDPQITPAGGSTDKRCAIHIKPSATGFAAENLSFENTYQFKGDGSLSNESADAIRVDADQSTFVNVKLIGYQDTLQANTNHQYFYKCYITGNVDFIYGTDARVLIEDSDIVYRYNALKNSGYVIAPKTDIKYPYGFIFNECRITAEKECSGDKYLLARPWGADASVAFINTYMSDIINKEVPYADMNGSYRKARFKEYYSYGDGYAINSNRPQISKAQAEEMLTADFLGWNPYEVSKSIGETDFVGDVVTDVPEKFIENTPSVDQDVDTGLGAYSVEGYARKVTGGGMIAEEAEGYYKVSTAEEFLSALQAIKTESKPGVIELTDDINLGSIEIGDALNKYSKVIKPVNNAPLLHPTLLKTGVSTLNIKDMSNLTIYSKNGSALKHTCVNISNASNIIIRNIVFDEIWEWDEGGIDYKGEYCVPGDYDRNDWDYINVQNGSTNVWIDHCTFYKAYDGIVDIKKAGTSPTNVTISWCKFLPESESGFFDEMMDLLESNPEKYPYYNKLITTHGMTKEQVRRFASAQKKTHLVGASDKEANIENLQLTLANNYYKNSMDRMPRLRGGNAHVYNCILDAADIYKLKNEVTDAYMKEKVVSNGAISTCDASVLLENTVIDGIVNALASGNGSSPGGFINALNTVYYMDGKLTQLGLTDNAGTGMLLDVDQFKANLPYSNYNLYNATRLSQKVVPFAGAGVVEMSSKQWQKTKYNEEVVNTDKEVIVNFNYDGATENNKVVKLQVVVGNTYGVLPEPTKAGYTFLGWYDEKGNKVTAQTVVSNEAAHNLTAKWQKVSSNNEKPSTGGGGSSNKHNVTVNVVTTPNNPDGNDNSAGTSFKDISGHWAEASIHYVSEKGILKGISANNFGPNKTMTRAMFANMLYRLANQPGVEAKVVFKDVKENAWYTNAIVWANEENIIKGMNANEFVPNGEITREQMAVMLYNYLKVSNKIPHLDNEIVNFNDADKVSDWAEEAMIFMVQAGIMKGDNKGNCNPKAKATRAEVSTMIHRLMIALENK